MTSLDVVVPVYNEERDLPKSIACLHQFLQNNMASYRWRIVIADNASTDGTLELARQLARQYPGVDFIHLPQKGRGRALRQAWLGSDADIVSYMDVDLSTDLATLPPLVKAIAEEGYDVATGSRLMRGSRVTRSFKREAISRIYNLMIKAMFFTRFHDAQCGFKALSRKAVQELVPLVQNQRWFFDSEILILAHQRGYRIKEIPVTWREDPGTTVKIAHTAAEDIRGLLRLRFRPRR